MANTFDLYPSVYKVMKDFGTVTVREMKKKLKASGKVASGDLYNSINYQIVDNGDTLSLAFAMEDYGQYVNEGRKPGKFPPLNAIKKWLKIKGIDEDAAFPIAKHIEREGIEPTYFMLISNTKYKNYQNKLEKAYAKDQEAIIQKAIKDLDF